MMIMNHHNDDEYSVLYMQWYLNVIQHYQGMWRISRKGNKVLFQSISPISKNAIWSGLLLLNWSTGKKTLVMNKWVFNWRLIAIKSSNSYVKAGPFTNYSSSRGLSGTIACWVVQKKSLTGSTADMGKLVEIIYMEYVKYLHFAYSSCWITKADISWLGP